MTVFPFCLPALFANFVAETKHILHYILYMSDQTQRTGRWHRLPIQIRFNDVDRYGHVNNNAYFSYYDLGKEEFLNNVLHVNYPHTDVVPVIANINADFIEPIFYGNDIAVETRVSHVGQKSFTLEQQAINLKTGRLVCRCHTVMVCFSLTTQLSIEIPGPYRQALMAEMVDSIDEPLH